MNNVIANEINILGYSGTYLALLFETLSALDFQGGVRIIMNEEKKRSPAPFETNIDYSVIHYSQVLPPPQTGFVLCNNNPKTKLFLTHLYQETWGLQPNQYTSLLHPSSVVASTATSQEGLYVEPLSVISPYTQIGFGVTVNRNCSVGHHSMLHDFCSIHPGTTLCGEVVIGRAATVGPGCTVFNGVSIGENSVIGGGSVVTKNIPNNVLAIGNPCRVVKEIL